MKKRSLDDKKTKMLTVKVTPAEMERMKGKAAMYCNGNLSDWVRMAAQIYNPK